MFISWQSVTRYYENNNVLITWRGVLLHKRIYLLIVCTRKNQSSVLQRSHFFLLCRCWCVDWIDGVEFLNFSPTNKRLFFFRSQMPDFILYTVLFYTFAILFVSQRINQSSVTDGYIIKYYYHNHNHYHQCCRYVDIKYACFSVCMYVCMYM